VSTKHIGVADIVLDTSAILAFLWGEHGGEHVADMIDGAAVSANIVAEVTSKLSDRGISQTDIATTIKNCNFEVYPVTYEGALAIGALRPLTKSAGLSLGDRSCLALAAQLGLLVITADKSWATVADAVGVEVRLIR
jgi:ribonuclease VapC